MCMKSLQSCPTPTLWTITRQAHLSKGFSRQEYWSGLPGRPQRDLPYPAIDPTSLISPTYAGGFFTTGTTWETPEYVYWQCIFIYRHHVMFITKLGFMLLSLALLLNISRNRDLMSVYCSITWMYCILTLIIWNFSAFYFPLYSCDICSQQIFLYINFCVYSNDFVRRNFGSIVSRSKVQTAFDRHCLLTSRQFVSTYTYPLGQHRNVPSPTTWLR